VGLQDAGELGFPLAVEHNMAEMALAMVGRVNRARRLKFTDASSRSADRGSSTARGGRSSPVDLTIASAICPATVSAISR